MINHNQALEFIRTKVTQENIVKHMLACEALMSGVYDYLALQDSRAYSEGELKQQKNSEGVYLAGTKEEWMMAGLIHDGDYCPEVDVKRQGIQIVQWLKEKGYEVPDNVSQTTASHNWHNTGIEPKTLMDWALFCSDTLTGLITATTLVRPERKLALVEVNSVLKKFKNPSFAAGTRREEIAMCQEKLGIPLEEFVKIGLESMQKISNELGL